ncbi:MAG: DEAD/DEAH box helicase [Candidatus Marsarchaeota archaeon]|nr:DEAD/DEAH box helicase [Candidatus Marsarchaeota archaeon]
MKNFSDLHLKPEILNALNAMNFTEMTEVQESAIPAVLSHKDIIVRSKTGSGKTGAFLIPIMQIITGGQGYPQAIVLVPTRELALQVNAVAHSIAQKSRIRTTVVYGGASINVQVQNLRNGIDIVIGTPGRVLDLVERGALKLDKIKHLVLDEADLMLDMGFIEDVEAIISMMPENEQRQTLLFSATIPTELSSIARRYMKFDAVKINIGKEESVTVSTITHSYYVAGGRSKFSALLGYIDKFNPKKCIIFTSTQREADFVHDFLRSIKYNAIVMHGGMSQAKREQSLHAFKTHATFLISTNLAARGLDINDVSDVINFDAPEDPRTYVHRVGRSARMGKDGRAFTIFKPDEEHLKRAICKLANVNISKAELDIAKFKDIAIPEMKRNERKFGNGRFSGNQRGRNFYSSGQDRPKNNRYRR